VLLLVLQSSHRHSPCDPRTPAGLAILMPPLILSSCGLWSSRGCSSCGSLRCRSSRSPRVVARRVVLARPLVGWPSCGCSSCRPHAAARRVALVWPLVVWSSHGHSSAVCVPLLVLRSCVAARHVASRGCSSRGPCVAICRVALVRLLIVQPLRRYSSCSPRVAACHAAAAILSPVVGPPHCWGAGQPLV